jgi:hypothetical protein
MRNGAVPARKSMQEGGFYIIGTYTGPEPSGQSYRDWRFSTFVPNYWGMYFERWAPVDPKHQLWYWDRAYLSLYRQNRLANEETEILALHCDPNESGGTHLLYKQGPHLHITVAEHPIPHSHLALNQSDLRAILASAEGMSNAMGTAVQMISHQVLAMYQAEGSLPKLKAAV